jgi:hypothetical protein
VKHDLVVRGGRIVRMDEHNDSLRFHRIVISESS